MVSRPESERKLGVEEKVAAYCSLRGEELALNDCGRKTLEDRIQAFIKLIFCRSSVVRPDIDHGRILRCC